MIQFVNKLRFFFIISLLRFHTANGITNKKSKLLEENSFDAFFFQSINNKMKMCTAWGTLSRLDDVIMKRFIVKV